MPLELHFDSDFARRPIQWRTLNTRNYIIATAGHVDHGKSALVKALTGIDPDRLPEEKARGITIDLGFAHLSLPGLNLGIVDVPGHEDFVKNMVAGVGSIDLALLIVAADDGWMPQTEEHLQILTYLGVRRGVIALTKSDLIDPGDEQSINAIRERLGDTPFQDAPIVKTSVMSGAGLSDLKTALSQVLANTPVPRDIGKPRLPVDRVFTLRGVGTVVTGTLSGGVLHRGQTVVIRPGEARTRIRTVQSHSHEVEASTPGTRTALNLPDVAADAGIHRGDTITLAELGESTRIVDVLLEKSARLINTSTPAARPLKDGTRARVHHSSANYAARVLIPQDGPLGPGEKRIAQFRFESPVFMFVGDRFIVRDWSEQWTLAGGVVLDPDASPRRLRSPAQRAFLEARAQSPDDLRVLITSALKRDHAAALATLLTKSRFSTAETTTAIDTLAAEKILHRGGDWVLDAAWWSSIKTKAAEAVHAEHRAHPDRTGLALSELRKVTQGLTPTLFDVLVADLCKSGFAQSGTVIRYAEHRLALPAHLQAQGTKLRLALANKPFEPPTRKELTPDTAAQQALKFLLQSSEAVELDAETVMLAEQYANARKLITDRLQKVSGATASELRQLLNTSRRVIIPLLEKLDKEGVTLRQGDKRVLKKR